MNFPIIAVVYDDGSTGSQEMASVGAARGVLVELKLDKTALEAVVYDANGKVDWSWEREE